MPVPYFASALGQPHKKPVDGLTLKRSRKRKRGTDDPEETGTDAHEPLLHEVAHNDEDVAGTATTATTFGSSSGAGLRQQDLSVLTSLLHRCILEKDYQRASRAWGMLLRMEVNGHPLDIRAQERWGIGAELLLHGGTSLASQVGPEGNETSELDKRRLVRPAGSLQRGLIQARHYYERLILQFPYRKTAPESISSLTFYPVMFGIWIHSVQLRYKIALQKSLQYPSIGNSVDSDIDSNGDNKCSCLSSNGGQVESRFAAYQAAIQDANEILERLNELLISPPCSDHSGLWKILGMLHLWIGHLSDHATVSQNYPDSNGDGLTCATSTGQSSHSMANLIPHMHDQRHSKKIQRDRQEVNLKAREAFSRVLALSDTLDARTRQEVGL
ncbi:MAG: hypothetical protein Q9188_001842 [Gyalolechia gomerana]